MNQHLRLIVLLYLLVLKINLTFKNSFTFFANGTSKWPGTYLLVQVGKRTCFF